MNVIKLSLPGLFRIEPRIFEDERGFFLESWSEERYCASGMPRFVQDNHSRSVRNTIRGLHYQAGEGQAKLVRVVSGCVWDVAVDLRPDSPTFGKWEGVLLDAEKHRQLFVPAGFAHGFCVMSDEAEVLYKVSTPYASELEQTIAWDDPDIGVRWPVDAPLLSGRDKSGESFASYKDRMFL